MPTYEYECADFGRDGACALESTGRTCCGRDQRRGEPRCGSGG